MNQHELIERAKKIAQKKENLRQEPFFQKTVAWFVYLGLLRDNRIVGKRHRVTLEQVLQAGELEPRILEVLPAILTAIPDAIVFSPKNVPKDLKIILQEIRLRKAKTTFRGIEPTQYLAWLTSNIIDIARKRMNFRTLPRKRPLPESEVGIVLKQARQQKMMTQSQLANHFGLSIRVIRDLEQGKLNCSFKHVLAVLAACDRKISIY